MIVAKITFLTLLISVLLFGCKSTLEERAKPARLIVFDETQNALLEKAATELLNGRAVILGTTAFLKSDKVLIDRVSYTNKQHELIEGRHNDMAIVLSLLWDNKNCWLKRKDVQKMTLVANLKCTPLPNE